MSPESRPSPAPEPDPGNGTGQVNGSGANGAGNGSGANGHPVLVASGAESALAAVERHLRQEAIEARLVATGRPTVPTATTTTTSRPVAPGRSSTRVRVAPVPIDDGWDDDELWAEARPRRQRPLVDVDDLPDDERRAVGRLQARKVRRILRHISPWSVFKFSLFFYLCVWLIVLIAGVILWRVGQEAGAIDNVETFYAKATGEITFELDGRSVFRAAASAGVILVITATFFTVMLSLLFNLITDLTGGVRLTVVELGDARRSVKTRKKGSRSLLRRVRSGESGTDPAGLTAGDASPTSSVPAAR